MEQHDGLVSNFCIIMKLSELQPETIRIICGVITSVLGWINYYYQIKKNKKNEKEGK